MYVWVWQADIILGVFYVHTGIGIGSINILRLLAEWYISMQITNSLVFKRPL